MNQNIRPFSWATERKASLLGGRENAAPPFSLSGRPTIACRRSLTASVLRRFGFQRRLKRGIGQSKITQVDFGSGETTRVNSSRAGASAGSRLSILLLQSGGPGAAAHAGRYAKFWLDPVQSANNRGSPGS